MKNYCDRVPYGKEKRLNIGVIMCPVCEVQPGQYHEYGCFAEERPQCHDVLLNCHCRCIYLHEGQLHIKAISASFCSLEEVCAVIYAPIVHEVPSLFFVAAWVTVMELAGLEPDKFDNLGDPLYSPEAVRACPLFGVPLDKAVE